MIHQTAECILGAISSMLNPGLLIDRLLDRIETLGCVMLAEQAGKLACREMRTEARELD
jgi:acyl-coenzyme A synthetase/AMP-(fatty) acid ligase